MFTNNIVCTRALTIDLFNYKSVMTLYIVLLFGSYV